MSYSDASKWVLDHYLLDLSGVESRSLNCLNGLKGSLVEPHLMVSINPIRTTIVANTGLLGTEVYMTRVLECLQSTLHRCDVLNN